MHLLQELLNTGAPVSYIILASFIVATFLFFFKFYYFHSINLDSEGFLLGIKNNLRKAKIVEALSICKDTNTPVSTVCEAILTREKRSEAALKSAAEEAALIEVPRLQQNCRLIATIGQLCPMLGLFGTVVALMSLFLKIDQIGASMSISQMAPYVRNALITTAMGIASGMFIQLYNAILNERCSSIVNDMEKAATELINFIIEPEALADKLNATSLDSAKKDNNEEDK